MLFLLQLVGILLVLVAHIDASSMTYVSTITIENFSAIVIRGQLDYQLNSEDINSILSTLTSIYQIDQNRVTFTVNPTARIIDSTNGDVVTLAVDVGADVPLVDDYLESTVVDLYNSYTNLLTVSSFNQYIQTAAFNSGSAHMYLSDAIAVSFTAYSVSVLYEDYLYFTTVIQITDYTGTAVVTPAFQMSIVSSMTSILVDDAVGFNAPYFVTCVGLGTLVGSTITVTVGVYIPQEGPISQLSGGNDAQYSFLTDQIDTAFVPTDSYNTFTTYMTLNAEYVYTDFSGIQETSTANFVLYNPYYFYSAAASNSPTKSPSLPPAQLVRYETLSYVTNLQLTNYTASVTRGQRDVILTEADMNAVIDAMVNIYSDVTDQVTFSCDATAAITDSTLADGLISIIVQVTASISLENDIDYQKLTIIDVYNSFISKITVSNFNSQLAITATYAGSLGMIVADATGISFSTVNIDEFGDDVLYYTSTITISQYSGSPVIPSELQTAIIATYISAYESQGTSFNVPYYVTCESVGSLSGTDLTVDVTTWIPQEGPYSLLPTADQYQYLVTTLVNQMSTGNPSPFTSTLRTQASYYGLSASQISSSSVATFVSAGTQRFIKGVLAPTASPTVVAGSLSPSSSNAPSVATDYLTYVTVITIQNYIYTLINGQRTVYLNNNDINTIEDTMSLVYKSYGSIISFDCDEVATVISGTGNSITINVNVQISLLLTSQYSNTPSVDIYNELLPVLTLSSFNTNLATVAVTDNAPELSSASAILFDALQSEVIALNVNIMYFTTNILLSDYSGTIFLDPNFQQIIDSTISSIYSGGSQSFNAPSFISTSDFGTLAGTSINVEFTTYVPQEGQFTGDLNTQYNYFIGLLNNGFTSGGGSYGSLFNQYLYANIVLYDGDSASGLSSSAPSKGTLISNGPVLTTSDTPTMQPTNPFIATDYLTYVTTITISNYAYQLVNGQRTVYLSYADTNAIEDALYSVYASLGSLIDFDCSNVATVVNSITAYTITINVDVTIKVLLIQEFSKIPAVDIYNQITPILKLNTFNANLVITAVADGANDLSAYPASATVIDNQQASVIALNCDILYFTTTLILSNYDESAFLDPNFQQILDSTMSSVYSGGAELFNVPSFVTTADFGSISGTDVTVVVTTYIPQRGQYDGDLTEQYNYFISLIGNAFQNTGGAYGNYFNQYLVANIILYDEDGASGLQLSSRGTFVSNGNFAITTDTLAPVASPTFAPFTITTQNTLIYTNFITIRGYAYSNYDFGLSDPTITLTPEDIDAIETAIENIYNAIVFDPSVFSGGKIPSDVEFICSPKATADPTGESNNAAITIIVQVSTITPLTGDFLNMAITDIYNEFTSDLTPATFNSQIGITSDQYNADNLVHASATYVDFSVTDVVINNENVLQFSATIQITDYTGPVDLSDEFQMDMIGSLTASYFIGQIPFNAPYFITCSPKGIISNSNNITITLTTNIPQEGPYYIYTYNEQYTILTGLLKTAFQDLGAAFGHDNFFSLFIHTYANNVPEITVQSEASLLSYTQSTVNYFSLAPTTKPSSGPPVLTPTKAPYSPATTDTLVYDTTVIIEKYQYVTTLGQTTLYLTDNDINSLTVAYYGVYISQAISGIYLACEPIAKILDITLGSYVTIQVTIHVTVPLIGQYLQTTVFDDYFGLIQDLTTSQYNAQLDIAISNDGDTQLNRADITSVYFTSPGVQQKEEDTLYFATTITVSDYIGGTTFNEQFQTAIIVAMTSSYLGLTDQDFFDAPYYIRCDSSGTPASGGGIRFTFTTYIPQEGPYSQMTYDQQYATLSALINDAFTYQSYLGENLFSYYLDFFDTFLDGYYLGASGITDNTRVSLNSIGPYVTYKSDTPTLAPTSALPTLKPTTYAPTTRNPTFAPTVIPTRYPTTSPVAISASPTTATPTSIPTTTATPTSIPTTAKPSDSPISSPTRSPTNAVNSGGNSQTSSTSTKKSLSGGAVAAIVITVLFLVVAGVIGFMMFVLNIDVFKMFKAKYREENRDLKSDTNFLLGTGTTLSNPLME